MVYTETFLVCYYVYQLNGKIWTILRSRKYLAERDKSLERMGMIKVHMYSEF
jgi:hypothetical protein